MSQTDKTGKQKLTTKQQRFVEYYDGNGVEAVRKAGYSGSYETLRSIAKENLTKPHIKAAIDAREAKTEKKGIGTREARQKFWTDTMNDPDADMKDRLKASELLGRSFADFTDKVKTDGNINVTVVSEYVEPDGD